jgi:predicted transcriptional regulator
MSFQPIFAQFWEKVKESIENHTYAKLTLAKTIGDTELKNIYVRPVLNNDVLSMSIIARYKTEEAESFHSVEETFFVLAPYINNPFLTAILFTTENDFTFKLNKKRVGTIIEQAPTFKNASDVILEMKRPLTPEGE